MILIDGKGHMVATGGEEELHAFARKIGLARHWYQDRVKYPHYDLTSKGKWYAAIKAGARLVPSRMIVTVLKQQREERIEPLVH